jgi:hypothetical protein
VTVARLRRFPERRFIGTRDDMRVYDCDDEAQFATLSARIDSENLVARRMVSSFGPDTLAEARNRGFEEVASSK